MHLGETKTVEFRVRNKGDQPAPRSPTFNVQPDLAAQYFNKLSCFCFNQTVLKPHQTRDLPVVFFVDPALAKDKDIRSSTSITLSYTFFASKTASPASLDGGPARLNWEAKPWPTSTPSITTTISSIRALGRSSALSAFCRRRRHHVDARPRHRRHALGPYLAGVGAIGILYTMISWWSDVIHEAQDLHLHTRVVQLHHRYGMMMFIASEVMFFVAWFWAFFDASIFPRRSTMRAPFTGGIWPPKGIERLRSLALAAAQHADPADLGHDGDLGASRAAARRPQGLKAALCSPSCSACSFTCVQAYRVRPRRHSASRAHIYGATFFMATGFHGFHVIIGTIFLIVCLLRAYRGDFTPKQHLGFESAAWYWHFVDVVWLFLFASIYVWGTGGGAAANAG